MAETPHYLDTATGKSTEHAEKMADKFAALQGLKDIIAANIFPAQKDIQWRDAANPYLVTGKDSKGVLQVLQDNLDSSSKIQNPDYIKIAYENLFKNVKNKQTTTSKIFDVNALEAGDTVYVENGNLVVTRKADSKYENFSAPIYPWGTAATPSFNMVEDAKKFNMEEDAKSSTSEAPAAPTFNMEEDAKSSTTEAPAAPAPEAPAAPAPEAPVDYEAVLQEAVNSNDLSDAQGGKFDWTKVSSLSPESGAEKAPFVIRGTGAETVIVFLAPFYTGGDRRVGRMLKNYEKATAIVAALNQKWEATHP